MKPGIETAGRPRAGRSRRRAVGAGGGVHGLGAGLQQQEVLARRAGRRRAPTRCPGGSRSASRRAWPCAATARSSSSVRQRTARRSGSTSRSTSAPRSRVGHQLGVLVADVLAHDRRASPCRARRLSGVTWPETTISPTPHEASTTILERSPLVGSIVIATPATRALTIFCTATAIDRSVSGMSFLQPVDDGAAGVERGPAAAYVLAARPSKPVEPQVGVLLAGEARVGQVLGRGRRAHGDRAPRRRSGPSAASYASAARRACSR